MQKRMLMILSASLVFPGCGGSGGSEGAAPEDKVEILSVTPASAVAGTPTQFEVEVKYDLETADQAALAIGFNDGAAYNVFIQGKELVVQRGSGTYTLVQEAIPVDWSPEPFRVKAYLQPYPLPDGQWTPLATDAEAITVSAQGTTAAKADGTSQSRSERVCYEQQQTQTYCVDYSR